AAHQVARYGRSRVAHQTVPQVVDLNHLPDDGSGIRLVYELRQGWDRVAIVQGDESFGRVLGGWRPGVTQAFQQYRAIITFRPLPKGVDGRFARVRRQIKYRALSEGDSRGPALDLPKQFDEQKPRGLALSLEQLLQRRNGVRLKPVLTLDLTIHAAGSEVQACACQQIVERRGLVRQQQVPQFCRVRPHVHPAGRYRLVEQRSQLP